MELGGFEPPTSWVRSGGHLAQKCWEDTHFQDFLAIDGFAKFL